VDQWVQGLDATVQTLRKTCDLFNCGNWQARLRDRRCSGAGRHNLRAGFNQGLRYTKEIGLVVDRYQGTPDTAATLILGVRRVDHVHSTFRSTMRHVRVAS